MMFQIGDGGVLIVGRGISRLSSRSDGSCRLANPLDRCIIFDASNKIGPKNPATAREDSEIFHAIQSTGA